MSRTLFLPRLRRLLTKEGDSFYEALHTRSAWKPREVEIRLTWACDADCVMCGLHSYMKQAPPDYNKPIPIPRLLETISELSEMGCESILFSGGEVTLLKSLPEIISHCSASGIAPHINTHGGRLTTEYCDSLLESGLRGLMISLDAPDAALHDEIRRLPGAFETATSGMAYIHQQRPNKNEFYPLINTVILKQNFRSLDRMVDLAADLGISEINFSPVSVDNAWDDWAMGTTDLCLNADDEIELERAIFPAILEKAKRYKINVMIPATVHEDGSIQVTQKLFNDRDVNCAVTFYHAVINVNGEVIPCCYASAQEFSMGNVLNQSFGEIWNGEPFLKFREKCFPARYAMCKSCSQHRNENELIERWYERRARTSG